MRIETTLAELVADLDAQRTKVQEAEARIATELDRLKAELPAQLDIANKDFEIGRLWARIHELEGSEAHLRSVVAAKDDEIVSLIQRLKGYEELQAKMRELEPDDLKKIYGIGPVLEKKLHAAGVTKFEQIGRWTDAEIEAFQAQLTEAKIRSDAWIKSAREQYQRKYRRPLAYS